MKYARSYILTINNEKRTDDELKEYIKNVSSTIKYCIFQREIGEKKETEHIQLYIEFTRGVEFERIKKWFPYAHIESRKGSREQARLYCSKDETRKEGHQPIEIGEWLPTQQGKRTDINIVLDMIENGATLDEVRKQYTETYFKYMNKIKQYQQEILQEEFKNKWRDLTVVYVYGLTGIGKTRTIMEHYGYDNVYRVTDYEHPFELYESQQVIIFEEFRNSLKIEEMLNYLDGYPLQLPARYANKTACFNKVFILSNWRFNEQYKNIQENYVETYNAFKRRINAIFNIVNNDSVLLLKKYLSNEDLTEQILTDNKYIDKITVM